MKNPFNVVAAVGLALGGVFGMVETVVTQRNLQAASWSIDGVALVVATSSNVSEVEMMLSLPGFLYSRLGRA